MGYVRHWPLVVPLLWFVVYLPRGTRLRGGFRKLSVFINMRGRGMQSVTSTVYQRMAGGCSFSSLRGARWVARHRRSMGSRARRRVSSYSGHGLSTDVTVIRGASGAQPEDVAYGRWVNAHEWAARHPDPARSPICLRPRFNATGQGVTYPWYLRPRDVVRCRCNRPTCADV